MNTNKHILIAPLNWGLGHATRCIPIINQFLACGANVLLASDGDALALLQAEYPQLTSIELPSYSITYKTANMFLNIAPQVPKILKAIRLERRFLDTIINQYKIDAIISDNRYGLYHPDIPSVLLTHQLNIPIPNYWVEKWIGKMNAKYIQKFDTCWVPDFEQAPNLAGKLSHQKGLKNISYLGLLSRMKYQKMAPTHDIVVVLSGPEPQRSIFEQKIIAQAKSINRHFLIIQGKPSQNPPQQVAKNIELIPYMTSKKLNKTLLQSQFIIARSGYSTIMDLVQLKCPKALLVPTPGQTEQEYLAERFASKNYFIYQKQFELNILEALSPSKKISLSNPFPIDNNPILETTIKDFLNTLD